MDTREILFNNDCRAKLFAGVDKTADAVKVTMGARGRNVVMHNPHGLPRMTKDGVSVARSVKLADPVENMGAQMLIEVASKTESEAGDGTTASCVLTQAILRGGNKLIAAGMCPVNVKIGIDHAVSLAKSHILPKPVVTKEDFRNVALISANGDTLVADLIADAMFELSDHGVVKVEEAENTELVRIQGMELDRGFLHPMFINTPVTSSAEFTFPLICVHRGVIRTPKEMQDLMKPATGDDPRPLVVFADDFEQEAIQFAAANRTQLGFPICLVRAPSIGKDKDAILEDIAIITGGQVIAPDTGHKLSDTTREMYGTAEHVSIDALKTLIKKGAGTKEEVEARCEQITNEISKAPSEHQKERLSIRASKLADGIMTIRVGGRSEVELKERRDRVDDALSATVSAKEEGIVAGGGVTLLNASFKLKDVIDEDSWLDDDEKRAGARVVVEALKSPIHQICANAGVDGNVTVAEIAKRPDGTGYCVRDGFADMIAVGIVDPAKVVRCALENAAAMAGLMLTTEAVISPYEYEEVGKASKNK